MPFITNQIRQTSISTSSHFKDVQPLASRPTESFGITFPVRFYLNKRIKRTGENQVHLKISFFPKQHTPSATHTFPSLLRKKTTHEDRTDKFVAVDTNKTLTVRDLRTVALEKFHLSKEGLDIEHNYQLTLSQTRRTSRPGNRRMSALLCQPSLFHQNKTCLSINL